MVTMIPSEKNIFLQKYKDLITKNTTPSSFHLKRTNLTFLLVGYTLDNEDKEEIISLIITPTKTLSESDKYYLFKRLNIESWEKIDYGDIVLFDLSFLNGVFYISILDFEINFEKLNF